MMVQPVQIRQTPALLGIDADPGKQEMSQPRATLEITTERSKLEMRQPQGELDIDQSRAWDALGLGNMLESMNRIYSQAKNVALQGIARIVENGNRLAAIHLDTNAFADIAEQQKFEHFELDYFGPASFDNVDIHYTARKPEISYEPAKVNIYSHPNRPEHIYHRGKLDIYMIQYPKVEFTPPQLDVKI